jgi:hypothetical protein
MEPQRKVLHEGAITRDIMRGDNSCLKQILIVNGALQAQWLKLVILKET